MNLTLKEFLELDIVNSKYLSKVSGVSYGMLRHFACGRAKNPSKAHVEKINKAISAICEQLCKINITLYNEKNNTNITM